MPELTLESLAARVAALEQQLAERKAVPPPARVKDWRRSVGMFDDDPDFAREVLAEAAAIREAEREAARRGDVE